MSSYIKNKESENNNLCIKLTDENYYDVKKKLTDNKLPKNYGNKWSTGDVNLLIDLLQKSQKLPLDDVNNNIINDLAKKLGRSVGGIKGEIKKIVFDRYIKGISINEISEELNLTHLNIKSMIKLHIIQTVYKNNFIVLMLPLIVWYLMLVQEQVI
jgi:hypothetical protein